uniref:Putative kinase phosphorylation protein n=1 Tax=Amblyomma aureolatum TaxID=187763 RepID=A0A1E1X1Z1_9ACAR
MFHPVRGGTRGGADQFNWEDVKDDKYRENYLGHSLRAPVGRWQKGKDLTWYAKEKSQAASTSRESEIAAAKRAEEEAMLAALGFATPAKPTHQPLTKTEVTEALRRGDGGRDDMDADRVSGVGINARGDFCTRGKRPVEGVEFISPAAPGQDVRRKEREESSSKKHKAEHKKEKKSKKHKKEKHKKKHKHHSRRSPS